MNFTRGTALLSVAFASLHHLEVLVRHIHVTERGLNLCLPRRSNKFSECHVKECACLLLVLHGSTFYSESLRLKRSCNQIEREREDDTSSWVCVNWKKLTYVVIASSYDCHFKQQHAGFVSIPWWTLLCNMEIGISHVVRRVLRFFCRICSLKTVLIVDCIWKQAATLSEQKSSNGFTMGALAQDSICRSRHVIRQSQTCEHCCGPT